ncbi:MAG: ribonuclease III [Verrucomicrobia bacterium]|nr:ribonuclease III [Verrucomicrobiota bacterium]
MTTPPAAAISNPDLEERLQYTFQDPSLLVLALTHPSLSYEQNMLARTNQRLEFLGDAVLQLALTHELYHRFPGVGEGILTKARARLVNSDSLAERGRALNLGLHVLVSRGEEMHGGRERASTLADCFEAVLGAMYLDGGLEPARAFVLREFGPILQELSAAPAIDNPKGELQELIQANSAVAPEYELISSEGPDHDRVFECVARHLGIELGRGRGKSKKSAESEAALKGLETLRAKPPEAPAVPPRDPPPGAP